MGIPVAGSTRSTTAQLRFPPLFKLCPTYYTNSDADRRLRVFVIMVVPVLCIAFGIILAFSAAIHLIAMSWNKLVSALCAFTKNGIRFQVHRMVGSIRVISLVMSIMDAIAQSFCFPDVLQKVIHKVPLSVMVALSGIEPASADYEPAALAC